METYNDRSNRQGENFNDAEGAPQNTTTPAHENLSSKEIDQINDDFLANDDKDQNTETETGTASQKYEKDDVSAARTNLKNDTELLGGNADA